MKDFFTNGGFYPPEENSKTDAEAAHRLYFRERDKPLVNDGKSSLFFTFKTVALCSTICSVQFYFCYRRPH